LNYYLCPSFCQKSPKEFRENINILLNNGYPLDIIFTTIKEDCTKNSNF